MKCPLTAVNSVTSIVYDYQTMLLFHQMPLCVLSGGHGDNGITNNAVIIDLSQFNRIDVLTEEKVSFGLQLYVCSCDLIVKLYGIKLLIAQSYL